MKVKESRTIESRKKYWWLCNLEPLTQLIPFASVPFSFSRSLHIQKCYMMPSKVVGILGGR